MSPRKQDTNLIYFKEIQKASLSSLSGFIRILATAPGVLALMRLWG